MARPMKRVPFGRWLMAMALVEAWFVSSREWAGTHLFRKVVGIAHLVDPTPLASMPSFFMLSAIYLTCVALWTSGRLLPFTGAIAWIVLMISASLEASAIGRPNPTLDVIFPLVMLGAWEVGRQIKRAASEPERDAFAHEVVCGVLAAIFVLACTAKLSHTGMSWTDGNPLRLLVFERSFAATPPLGDLRLAFANTPWLARFASSYTVLVQGAGICFLWPRARKLWTLAVIPMFTGFAILMGMFQVPWVLLPIALSWSTFGLQNPAKPAPVG